MILKRLLPTWLIGNWKINDLAAGTVEAGSLPESAVININIKVHHIFNIIGVESFSQVYVSLCNIFVQDDKGSESLSENFRDMLEVSVPEVRKKITTSKTNIPQLEALTDKMLLIKSTGKKLTSNVYWEIISNGIYALKFQPNRQGPFLSRAVRKKF